MTMIPKEIWQDQIFPYFTLPEIVELGGISKDHSKSCNELIKKIIINQQLNYQDLLSSKLLSKFIIKYGKKLKSLNIKHRFIFDKTAFDNIGKNCSIESLKMGIDLGSDKLSFANYKSLETVEAKEGGDINKISRLEELKNLRTVELAIRQFVFENGKKIQQKHRCMELSVENLNKFYETNAEVIKKAPHCLFVRGIVFQKTSFGLLINLIKLSDDPVTSIDFSDLLAKSVKEAGVKLVCNALNNPSKIQQVSMPFEGFDLETIKMILKTKFFENVTSLDLNLCDFKTLEGLCEVLAECFPNLEKLTLGDPLQSKGGDKFLKNLQENKKYLKKLRMLSVETAIDTQFTDKQIKELAKERPDLHFNIRLSTGNDDHSDSDDEFAKTLKLQGNYAEIKNAKEIFFGQ